MRPTQPFLGWPLPAAGAAAAGALAAAHGETPALLALLLAQLLAAAALAALAPAALRRHAAAAGLALVATLTCALRYEAWEGRPNPAAPYYGEQRRWAGTFDGAYFSATEPVRARLALVTGSPPPVGRLVVSATAEPAPGRRNPGGFDYAAYLLRRGVVGQLFLDEVLDAEPLPGVRQRLERGVRAGLSPEQGALVSAVALGVKDDLGDELKGWFTEAGLAHLLALSGLHFGVLLACAAWVLRRLGRWRVYALMLVTGAFVLLVGPSPSVVRAAVMAGAYLVGTAAGVGRLEVWPVLGLAALVALLLQPQMLFDLSFQLSYLALIGLLTFTAPLGERLGRLAGAPPAPLAAGRGDAGSGAGGRGGSDAGGKAEGRARGARLGAFLISGTAASVAAQLPSLSLVAGSFGSVPLFSPLVNLVAVPVSTLLVPLGFGAGLLGLVLEPAAWLVNRLTLLVVALLTQLARWGSALPAVTWAQIGWLGHLCWAVAALALALHLHRRLGVRQLLGVVLVAGSCSAAAGGAQRPPDVWFLDVGQGDATLIRLPGRYEVLIDGGGSPFSDDDVGERVVLPALRALDVDELEVVVATHPDADHVEGLFTVLERLPVGTLVTAPAQPGNALDDRLRAVAAARAVAVHVATRAETLVIGRRGEATLEVLHPVAGGGGGSSNEESVVLVLRYRGAPAVLLLADVGVVTERELALGRVAVLKVGHHGSRHSTSEALLRAAAPRLAVISVGRNNYGHPHPLVLERLAAAGVPTVSTAAAGAVRLDLSRDELGGRSPRRPP